MNVSDCEAWGGFPITKFQVVTVVLRFQDLDYSYKIIRLICPEQYTLRKSIFSHRDLSRTIHIEEIDITAHKTFNFFEAHENVVVTVTREKI